MKKVILSLQLILCLSLFIAVQAQTLPVLPAPDHDVDHDAFINGTVTVDGTGQKIPGVIVKLSRVVAGPPVSYVPVSYGLSDINGNFSVTGQAGDNYILTYQYPTAGFTSPTGNPSASFIAAAGSNVAPGGGVVLQRIANTITNCNVSNIDQTDWTGILAVAKAPAIAGNTQASVTVYAGTLASHPKIEVTAATATTVRALKIGASVLIDGPALYSIANETVSTFANTPAPQNIVLTAGEVLTYWDISAAVADNTTLPSIPVEYTGTGDVIFNVGAYGSKTITTNGGNTTSSELTYAGAGVCLTYVYTIDILPVKLASFTAKAEGKVANLSWSTTEEAKSESFEVQRSRDARNWVAIGSRKAVGESTAIVNYSFPDNTPAHGQNFYRLKMIDTDGTFAYSRINELRFDNVPANLTFYPNPVVNEIFVQTNGTDKIEKIQIYNQEGKIVKESAFNDKSVNVSLLTSGIYSVRTIYTNGLTDKSKLVITH